MWLVHQSMLCGLHIYSYSGHFPDGSYHPCSYICIYKLCHVDPCNNCLIMLTSAYCVHTFCDPSPGLYMDWSYMYPHTCFLPLKTIKLHVYMHMGLPPTLKIDCCDFVFQCACGHFQLPLWFSKESWKFKVNTYRSNERHVQREVWRVWTVYISKNNF